MIRTMVADDLQGVRAVYRRASLSNDGDRASLLASPEVLVWDGTPEQTRVAVDVAGEVLGFATVITVEGGRELDDLFVDPDRMRQGIAMQLIRDAASSAEEAGVPWIEVTGNPHAAEFYAAAGFVYLREAQTLFGPAPRLRLTLSTTR